MLNFVSAHFQLKNTLDRAKEEMDAAAKTAQTEARAKAKTPVKKDLSKPDADKPVPAPKPAEVAKPEPPKTASLFDLSASSLETPATVVDSDEEAEILAEAGEDAQEDEDEELDEAA
jgi:hypothetical protein